MDALIYTVMSGANRALQGQHIHANNLANLETPGFRASLEQATATRIPGYGFDTRHMARLSTPAVSQRQGALRATDRALDVAINGPGLLALQGPDGEEYTRAGAITLDADGTMLAHGLPLLGQGGALTLPPHSQVQLGQDGSVSILAPGGRGEMQTIDTLKLVRAEPGELVHNEAGRLVARDGQPLSADTGVQLQSGFLEGANVSAIEEMVATIQLSRSFEIQMKLFKCCDAMAEASNRLVSR